MQYSKMSEIVFLSLGSNLGNREALLESALDELGRRNVRIQVVSSLYETEPVDWTGQPTFLNLACMADTDLSPRELLLCCKEIEQDLGRRTGMAKGPREIDIDILLFGDRIVDDHDLRIPHPGLTRRRFVLVPLVEIAPCAIDPASGETAAVLLSRCPDRSGVQRLYETRMRPKPSG